MKKLITLALIFTLALMLASCWNGRTILLTTKDPTTNGVTEKYLHYSSAEEFEKALDEGIDVDGAIVDFVLKDYKYSETENDNIYKAGKHLNFISDSKPIVEVGQKMTVRVVSTSLINDIYWVIRFEPPTQ